MMTPEAIKEALQDRRIGVVADATGLSWNTVWRARRGDGLSLHTVMKLSRYLDNSAAAVAAMPERDPSNA